MGFWDKVSKVGLHMVETAQRQAEQRHREVEKYEYKASRINDDRELVDKFKNSSGIEKYGYAKELEKRGYLERNSEGKFQRTNKNL